MIAAAHLLFSFFVAFSSKSLCSNSNTDHLQHNFCARSCVERCSSSSVNTTTCHSSKLESQEGVFFSWPFHLHLPLLYPQTLRSIPIRYAPHFPRHKYEACLPKWQKLQNCLSSLFLCYEHFADPYLANVLVFPLLTSSFLLYPFAESIIPFQFEAENHRL